MDSEPPEDPDREGAPTGAPPDAGDRLVTVARCSTTAPADFARSVLAQAGIEAVLQGQYLNQVFPFLAGALGGILVQVRLRDAATALELLRHPPAPIQAVAPEGEAGPAVAGAPPEEPLLRCPECGSASASFKPASPRGFVIVLLEKLIPLPFLHGHWVCDECGKRWLELSAPRV